jgi:hypothetical protein
MFLIQFRVLRFRRVLTTVKFEPNSRKSMNIHEIEIFDVFVGRGCTNACRFTPVGFFPWHKYWSRNRKYKCLVYQNTGIVEGWVDFLGVQSLILGCNCVHWIRVAVTGFIDGILWAYRISLVQKLQSDLRPLHSLSQYESVGRLAMGTRDCQDWVEGSFQNELITLLVTSQYLRAVVVINWVLLE